MRHVTNVTYHLLHAKSSINKKIAVTGWKTAW